MSSPLAIAAVTAILKDLLNEGLINNDLSPVGSFTVSALPPDRITTGETETSRLNLFLYQVTPNLGWRNAQLPSRDARGARLSNPPLALDLHYLLTAYGSVDLNAEVLLGFAMDLLNETPVLTRDMVRRSLTPQNPTPVNLIPPDPQGRTAIDLADQIETLKIIPQYLSADELSKLWTAMQARYRPTVAYQVTTVIIQGTRPSRSPLPVLSRGQGDRGVSTQPSTAAPLPAWPTLAGIEIAPAAGEGRRASAEMGDRLTLRGALLEGDVVTAEFRHQRLADPLERVATPAADGASASVALPDAAAAAADWPAGTYGVALRIERAGKATRRTNELAIVLAPRLKPPPALAAPGGQRILTINVAPQIWPGQRVDVLVGDNPFQIAVAAKTGTLAVPAPGVAPSDTPLPVRLRVDGAENNLVRDRMAQPPQFDPQQTVTAPP
ncbi:DUF4255 domain-containing protein [Methylocystis sp. IM3]|uniref:DUF4255 domain-containing protein n=2 Tax=Methylocystis TaxID=133 RepID=UPI0031199660